MSDGEMFVGEIIKNVAQGHRVFVAFQGSPIAIEVREASTLHDGALLALEDVDGTAWHLRPSAVLAVRYMRAN